MDAPILSYRRLVANVVAGAGARAAAIVTALALATVLVRTLGLAAYGTWAFFFVLIGYHALFDLGLSVAVERAVARAGSGDAARIGRLLRAGVALSLALSALLQLVVSLPIPDAWLASIGEPAIVRACLRVLPACLACSNVAAVAGAGLSGLQRTTTLARQRAVIGAGSAGAVMALSAAGLHRLDLLLVVYALGLLVTAGASWRAIRREVGPIAAAPWRAGGDAVRELAVVGGTLQATHLIALGGDQALRVVLGAAFGPAAIGVYDLASRAAIAPRSLMASLLVALVPFAAAREGAGGRAALSDSLHRSTRYATLAIAAGTIAGLSVAGPFMALWLGAASPAVDDARRMLAVLLVALAVQSIASPMVAIARAAGQPGPEAITTAVAQPLALLAAAQAVTLVTAVGVYAAMTTLLALILWVWLKVRLALDGLPWRDLSTLGAVVAGAAAIAAAARTAADALAVGALPTIIVVPAIAVAAVSGLALVSGAITRGERELLIRVARRR